MPPFSFMVRYKSPLGDSLEQSFCLQSEAYEFLKAHPGGTVEAIENIIEPPDLINDPPHYQGDGGVECIEAIEAMGCGVEFCRANAVKYLWRLGKKGAALEDAKKAQWYVERLVKQLSA